jgi:hypothetical protein
MNSDSRFAYFQLYNGTEIHLPRSVLELAAAPGSLLPHPSGIEALAAAILGVSSIDFLGWGLKPPSQASNALETKMVRAQQDQSRESHLASVDGLHRILDSLGVESNPNLESRIRLGVYCKEHSADDALAAMFTAVDGLKGYFMVEFGYDPVGKTWSVRVDGMSDDRRFGACESTLKAAVDYVLKKIEVAVLTKGLGARWEAPDAGDGTPVSPPSVGEIYGVPLLSRVYVVRAQHPILGRLCKASADENELSIGYTHCNQEELVRMKTAQAVVIDDEFGRCVPVSQRSQIRLALCCRCWSPQFWSPSGFTCKNGHGGADALPYEETPS